MSEELERLRKMQTDLRALLDLLEARERMRAQTNGEWLLRELRRITR